MTGYEIGLLAVAAVFIVFALVVALVIPRSRPEFPAKRLGIFVAICIGLFLAQMGAVVALAEIGEAEHSEAVEQPAETEPPATTPTEPTESETEPSGSTPVGREIFVANCAACHTLADAGTTGMIGPNLDDSAPPLELVVDRVTNGQGVMPSFEGSLSAEEIQEVAAYVAAAASG